jgi:tetratricopeptide (TPR) repeat protein
MTSHALWVMAWTYIVQEDSRRALEVAERSVRVAPTPADRSWAESTLGLAHCRTGNSDQAVEILAKQLPGYRARFIPSESFTPYLGEAYWRAGEYEKGRAVLEELLLITEPCGMRLVAAQGHRILQLGRIAEARDYLTRALEIFERLGTLGEPAPSFVASSPAEHGCGWRLQ